MQPIVLYSHHAGPNPKKVRMILEELSLPYECHFLEFPEMKMAEFLKINPNGRVPAITDPNNGGLTLWESGAIIEYLIETYDISRSISFPSFTTEWFQAKQWLHFQMSGQGPYFGQAVWFKVHHPEYIQSCYSRYVNEIRRVAGVLDRVLQDKDYLVGGKCSYADISFVIWFQFVPWVAGEYINLKTDYPHLTYWLNRVEDRPAVKKILDIDTKLPEKRAS
ncbi:glutathione S-transferase [Aspergillus bertholletiae]|uniref:glutathione transferase n=1 Tax=Aspergillus bertholletiae TaxID=1226010 RepID=A0A5N7B865_9EURO|nr:glutathione S-transferase [Aspergillus bertholletiae]